MMASSFPQHSTTTVSSQLMSTLAGNIPIIPPVFSTPSVAAANGFRPSIPPKNSRVPAGDIDKLSLSKMNNQANSKLTSVGTSATGGTQSLPPPPLPHSPIKGISNAQARTARKSAPSTSNRGDGYSTSSSGGGGKKSISGTEKDSGEKRDRVFSNLNEESDNDAFIEVFCPPQQAFFQTFFPTSPKSQRQTQAQAQNAQEQESQASPEMLHQIELSSPAVPAPPSFSGPSTQATSDKRPASPVDDFFSPGKPKRQKIATAKAAALANEPGMNADGSAVKRRKPRRGIIEKVSKEKEKPGKGKTKEKVTGQGMFAATMADRCETNSGTAVVQRLPNLPPPYQVPAHLQKQNTQQGQQAKRDSPIRYGRKLTPPLFSFLSVCSNSAAADLISHSVGLVVPDNSSPGTNVETNSTSQVQVVMTQRRTNDNIIPTSSLSVTQQIAASKLERRAQNTSDTRLMLLDDERGQNQNTPINIDDGSSEAEEGPSDARVPSDSRGKTDVEVRNHETKNSTLGYHYGSPGSTQVCDGFFTKCIDVSLSDDERGKLVVEIQKFIVELVAEAKKHCLAKASPEVGRFLPRQDSSTLEKLTALLGYMCVLTSEGNFITLDEWKGSGMPKFQGRFILQDYRDAWKETRDAKKSDNSTGFSGELQSPRKLDDRTTDINMTDVVGQQTIPHAGARKTQQVAAALNDSTAPSGKTKESSTSDKPKEGLALVSSSLQSMGATSSPSNLLIPHLSERPAAPASNPMPSQSSSEQKLSSPSTQVPVEAGALGVNMMAISEICEVRAPDTSSGKGKRKRFVTPSVQDFLKELEITQEVQSLRTSGFESKQERSDPLLSRIVELNQEELHVRDDIDALVVKSKLEEKDFERRIAGARICARPSVSNQELNSEFADDMANSPVDWEEFRKVTRELRDFQDNTRQTELRLADKATRIAEEKQYLIQRRKRMNQMESELDTTPSVTMSEGSTAPSSVSGSSASRQPPARVETRTVYPEMGVGYELLRALIPWATQFQETPTDSMSSVLTETGPNQTKSKKRPARKRKHW